MKIKILLILVTLSVTQALNYTFPPNFEFGAATGLKLKYLKNFPLNLFFSTASYQIEGAWNVDGKLQSIWDTASHKVPSDVFDGVTGDDAGKSYEFYMKDVQALKDVGVSVIFPQQIQYFNKFNLKSLNFIDSQLLGREL